jgi:hypothetical protein
MTCSLPTWAAAPNAALNCAGVGRWTRTVSPNAKGLLKLQGSNWVKLAPLFLQFRRKESKGP